jgi:transposase
LNNKEESMPQTRKSYPPSPKAKLAIEAIKGNKTVTQVAQTSAVHPNLLAFWNKQAIEHLSKCFPPIRSSNYP